MITALTPTQKMVIGIKADQTMHKGFRFHQATQMQFKRANGKLIRQAAGQLILKQSANRVLAECLCRKLRTRPIWGRLVRMDTGVQG